MSPRQPKQHDAQQEGQHAALEATLSYRFHDPALLTLALTHRSRVYESKDGDAASDAEAPQKNKPGTDNEQLEFLGDAALGLIVSEVLLSEFPDCAEGELTRIRATLVSRKRMGEMGEELGLANFLLLGKSAERNGARRRPALMANAAEAVLAAMYLDAVRAGHDGLAAIRALAVRYLVEPEIAGIRAALTTAPGNSALRDPKTLLQERVQAANAGKLRYIDTGQTGPAHDRVFTIEAQLHTADEVFVLAAAEGPSKKEAQQRAAALALETWSAEAGS